MSRKAANALKKDRVMAYLVKENGVQRLKPGKDYFNVLVTSIVYQQLSGASASAIYGRLRDAAGRVTPKNIAALTPAKMRKAGLSRQKISYLKYLAKKFLSREVNPRRFHSQSDSEIVEELVRIRGIGRWTAEMFLMFSLGREDVFPADDLGIRRAVERLYGFDGTKKELDEFAVRWKPYRSYASLYLWKSSGENPKNW